MVKAKAEMLGWFICELFKQSRVAGRFGVLTNFVNKLAVNLSLRKWSG